MYTKYRIVEKEGKYAIQGYNVDPCTTYKFVTHMFKTFEVIDQKNIYRYWQFLEYDNPTMEYYFSSCPKTYNNLKSAKTALMSYIDKNVIEPIESEKPSEDWEQVNIK